MRVVRIVIVIILLLGGIGLGLVLGSQKPVIGSVPTPAPASFDHAMVEKGARLAALGNCDVCHTVPGGADYAGGRPIPTPFGIVYSTNITPAPGTGLGHWSEEAFERAMREGVSRTGRHLYPAFPYTHFVRLDDDDIHALYAFLMTRRPVEKFAPANTLPFPLSQRWSIIFWNLLFFDRSPFRPDPQHDAEWNRGAYLVEGLGHCGDCHTPRNWLGAERTRQRLAGGEAEGWRAPALDANSPAPVPWDKTHLFLYLRQGWDVEHGAAAGPMQPVVRDLAKAEAEDVRAIAAYLATQSGEPSSQRRAQAEAASKRAAEPADVPEPRAGEGFGAALFAGACAGCHGGGPAMVAPRGIDLALSTVLNEVDPRDAIRIVLDGIRPGDEQAGPLMPRFAGTLTDGQIAALLAYLRAHYSDRPPWAKLEEEVRTIRQGGNRS